MAPRQHDRTWHSQQLAHDATAAAEDEVIEDGDATEVVDDGGAGCPGAEHEQVDGPAGSPRGSAQPVGRWVSQQSAQRTAHRITRLLQRTDATGANSRCRAAEARTDIDDRSRQQAAGSDEQTEDHRKCTTAV